MIFVDTSALISLFIASDDAHCQVQEIFHANTKEDFVTTHEILSETLNWIVREKIKKVFSLDSDFRILKHTQNLL